MQYKNHQENSKKRDELSYKIYQMQDKAHEKHNSLLYSPQDKLPKNYTGKDIIQKMQKNWYNDMVGKESAFQGVAKQILQ
jgi:hypothetical protein